MIQRGISCTEVIQRNPYSERADLCHDTLHSLHIIDRQTLCYLQGQVTGCNTRLLHRILHDLNYIILHELDHGEIDVHLELRVSVVIPFLTLLAGLLKYIIANRIDKSQIFCKRDKIRR